MFDCGRLGFVGAAVAHRQGFRVLGSLMLLGGSRS